MPAVDPGQFRFVSARLVQEIVEDYGSASYKPIAVGLKTEILDGTEVTLGASELDYLNRFDLLRHATALVEKRTGRLSDLRPEYIRDAFDLSSQSKVVWFGVVDGRGVHSESHEFAAFYADYAHPEAGRVLLLLIGSTKSFSGFDPNSVRPWPGRTPSDAGGLYRILQAAFEVDDPQVQQRYIDRDARMSESPIARCEGALYQWHHARGRHYGTERVECLFQVFDWLENFDLRQSPPSYTLIPNPSDSATYSRVILGTPVWIRAGSLPPLPDASVAERLDAGAENTTRKPRRWWRRSD